MAKTERLYPSGIVTFNVDDSSIIAGLTPGQVFKFRSLYWLYFVSFIPVFPVTLSVPSSHKETITIFVDCFNCAMCMAGQWVVQCLIQEVQHCCTRSAIFDTLPFVSTSLPPFLDLVSSTKQLGLLHGVHSLQRVLKGLMKEESCGRLLLTFCPHRDLLWRFQGISHLNRVKCHSPIDRHKYWSTAVKHLKAPMFSAIKKKITSCVAGTAWPVGHWNWIPVRENPVSLVLGRHWQGEIDFSSPSSFTSYSKPLRKKNWSHFLFLLLLFLYFLLFLLFIQFFVFTFAIFVLFTPSVAFVDIFVNLAVVFVSIFVLKWFLLLCFFYVGCPCCFCCRGEPVIVDNVAYGRLQRDQTLRLDFDQLIQPFQ